ncbi:DUF3883 domain-containing protein [Mesorhizobium sp. M2D.F.Ca.ET.185.01.1.1]|uniref:DUF3883 domain-containing protein n=1 Tax=unclassified Mesorhizobium TaxID=325217 RepID=UPI000FC99610|nr:MULTISPECIES: DUF3883 domain-containing protein [unclassified Mesorhizobium]TGU12784.1 DUF3883 domain-containing protein [bacterium M00.F.Ca.ET.163.01.1.1]TGU43709.1 DUF3883 domain-containing protein [bacterium M00.F.Ca.ET.146.01.1.1]TGV76878.1 DUF3883 domain-containing protein [Mesorhizobium sp. M00.F.Ca.ET.149.01.1.1]TGW09340.1 DUF3883 domain-containing protein [Mesorhizobium sp. M2D.F.Ca.ET.145.01.1.1]TGP31532.1 DUF3883 domain-containing protein [Mesorhizobium sp. M2D.F.Ca.ET.232.01.1.1]
MTSLTPGLASSALDLLRLLQRNALTASELLAGLKRVGGMPSAEALSLSQTLNWLEVDSEGVLQPTPSGQRACGQSDYRLALRQVLLDYADIVAPEWLQNAINGRSRVLAFAGPGIAQILVEAEVATGTSDDVVEFWDMLASLARGYRDDRLLTIGRRGERLTIAHEKARTGASPRWVALDSNQDGYDVLSVKAADDPAPLCIEVKTSTVGVTGFMHISRKEWDHALVSANHAFHLWDLRTSSPQLAVIGVAEMAGHMPVDAGSGDWREVRVPFRTFTSLFSTVAS